MYARQMDLHNHSYYSDGKYSPEQVLKQGKRAGLNIIAITDHNSISHLEEERKIAEKLKIFLTSKKIEAPSSLHPARKYYVTDLTDRFIKVAEMFLGEKIKDKIEKVSLSN